MIRVGLLGLLLFSASSSLAQSTLTECNRSWHPAEVDPCLLSFATDEKPIAAPEPGAAEQRSTSDLPESDVPAFAAPDDGSAVAIAARKPEKFQWGAAIQQSARLLAFQQGMMLATDKWARYSVSHGKFLKEYFAAVRGGLRQWDDGDPFLDNYVGHPLQGAVSGYIQIQNDPRGRTLTFGNNRAYWKSRLKAMGWIAAYSTQFEIGPISESSIENLGGFQYQNCPTCRLVHGAGWVDIVVTPTIGTAWLVGEDVLDRYVVRRIEGRLGRGKWSKFFRCVLNPARIAANALRMKSPWYRDDRDGPPLVAVTQRD